MDTKGNSTPDESTDTTADGGTKKPPVSEEQFSALVATTAEVAQTSFQRYFDHAIAWLRGEPTVRSDNNSPVDTDFLKQVEARVVHHRWKFRQTVATHAVAATQLLGRVPTLYELSLPELAEAMVAYALRKQQLPEASFSAEKVRDFEKQVMERLGFPASLDTTA